MTNHRRTAPHRKPIDGTAHTLDPCDLRILDAISHEAALAACERPEEPDDEIAIRSLRAFVADLIRRL